MMHTSNDELAILLTTLELPVAYAAPRASARPRDWSLVLALGLNAAVWVSFIALLLALL